MSDDAAQSAWETKAWLQHYPEWTPESLDYGDRTLLSIYRDNLTKNGNRTATYFFGKTLTWKELHDEVLRAAAGLRALGVSEGDRIALLMPNCPQHVIAFWATLAIGAVPVEHNPLYTAHELHHPFADHGAKVAIVWDKSCDVAKELREYDDTCLNTIVSVNMISAMPKLKQFMLRIPIPKITAMRNKLHASADDCLPWDQLMSSNLTGRTPKTELFPATGETPALVLYTSGTTGLPKGAELKHRNLVANIVQGQHWVPGIGEKPERFLAALPLFHAYGMTMTNLLAPLVGAELVLLPSPEIPLIMQIMKKHTPTWLPGVPALYEKIVEASEEQGVEIKGVRNAFSGASSLPVSIVKKWEEHTNGRLVEGYGLTETSPIIAGNPVTDECRPGYVGVPFPDTIIRIADPEDLSRTMPDGEPGELLVKGPQVFDGYLNNPEANEKGFHDGWYITGDVGVMEPDGFIRLVARTKEVIITGGFNVYPAEVEEVLLEHPDVVDATVVGLPRDDGSETVTAAVVLRTGAPLDPEGIKEFCRTMLTRYKIPRTLYHLDEMPRDQLGKVRRREVRDMLLESDSKRIENGS